MDDITIMGDNFDRYWLNGTTYTLKRTILKRETRHCCTIQNLRTLKENLTHIGWHLMKLRKFLIMDLFGLKPLMMGMLPSWWMGTGSSYIKNPNPRTNLWKKLWRKQSWRWWEKGSFLPLSLPDFPLTQWAHSIPPRAWQNMRGMCFGYRFIPFPRPNGLVMEKEPPWSLLFQVFQTL